MTPDYRNRPPVDAPRPTVRSALFSVSRRERVEVAAVWIAIGLAGFAMAVAAGLVVR